MKDREWRYLTVPSSWKGHRTWQDHPTLGTYTGYAWYRCFVRLPAEWAGERCRIYLGYVSEADHTYLNGELVGRTGELYRATGDRATGDRTPATSEYDIDPGIVRCGEWNVVAVRVHHSGLEDSGGGLVGVQYGMSDFLYLCDRGCTLKLCLAMTSLEPQIQDWPLIAIASTLYPANSGEPWAV